MYGSVALFAVVLLANAGNINAQDDARAKSGWFNSLQNEYRGKSLVGCLEELDVTCVKVKIASNLDKMLQMKSFQLFEGITMIQDENVPEQQARLLNDINVLEAPRSLEEKQKRIDQVLEKGFTRLFQSRSAKLAVAPGVALTLSRSTKKNGLLNVDVETNDSELFAEGE